MKYVHLFWAFLQLGTLAFGGGYTVIVIAERLFVQKLKWIKESELLDYLAMSQSLSGIITLNFSAFIGYKRAGVLGALLALLGVILTPFILVLFLAHLINALSEYPLLSDVLWGIKVGVCALIFSMAVRLMTLSLKGKNPLAYVIFLLTLTVCLSTQLSPVIPILLGAGFGICYWLYFKRVFNA